MEELFNKGLLLITCWRNTQDISACSNPSAKNGTLERRSVCTFVANAAKMVSSHPVVAIFAVTPIKRIGALGASLLSQAWIDARVGTLEER